VYFFYFFPVGLEGSLQRRPVVSRALLAVMLVVYLWQEFWPGALPVDPWTLVFQPGNGRPWTAATAVFLHGSWLHLAGNLLYLHVFAPALEDRLGAPRFLLYFLLIGVWGNLVHGAVAALGLLGQGGLGVLGASGAVAGLLALALVRFAALRVQIAWWVFAPLVGQNRAGRSPLPVAVAVAFWLGLQVVQAVIAPETGSTVSYGAHLGGFAMGLLLALATGQRGASRLEGAAVRARRYFREGHLYAAAGAWAEYVDLAPDDLEGRLELARALLVTDQRHDAAAAFRRVHRALMRAKRVDEALLVYDEAARAGLESAYTAEELSRVARFKERQLDQRGALDVYRRLYRGHPSHPQGQRALVRVIMLLHGSLRDAEAARAWLDEAFASLPPGTWRAYLEREFMPAATPGAGAAAGPAGPGPAAGS
jgi:membrane associated rhomboid family serine protease